MVNVPEQEIDINQLIRIICLNKQKKNDSCLLSTEVIPVLLFLNVY